MQGPCQSALSARDEQVPCPDHLWRGGVADDAHQLLAGVDADDHFHVSQPAHCQRDPTPPYYPCQVSAPRHTPVHGAGHASPSLVRASATIMRTRSNALGLVSGRPPSEPQLSGVYGSGTSTSSCDKCGKLQELGQWHLLLMSGVAPALAGQWLGAWPAGP
jgi:hypothetical protein